MIGYFKMIDKQGNELSKFKYATTSAAQKERLKKLKGVHFYCCCKDDTSLELKISSDLRLYPARQGLGGQHDPRCPRAIEEKKEELWTIKTEPNGIYYHNGASYATVKDYTHRLNFVTYDRLIHPELRLPDDYLGFNLRVHQTQKYIKTPAGDILFDICLSNNRNVAKLNTNKEYFFYGLYFDDAKVTPFNKEILYLDAEDCFGKKMRFYVEKDVYLAARETVNLKNPRMIVGLFAYKKTERSKILTISDLYLAPISELGIII